MNITDAQILDPRKRGIYADPILELRVDEPVFEQARPVFDGSKSLQYRVVPCGPFYAVEYRKDNGVSYDPWEDYTESLPLGEFGDLNASGLLNEQIMPVRVITPDDIVDLAMFVPRARRLIRRHSLGHDWNVIVDEQAALHGSLQWRVELRYPVCYGGAKPGSAHCEMQATHTIMHKGTHLTICEDHLNDHQRRLSAARASRTARV